MQIHWDPTINLGSVLAIVAFMATIFKFHGDIVKQLTAFNVKLDILWAAYNRQKRFTDQDQ